MIFNRVIDNRKAIKHFKEKGINGVIDWVGEDQINEIFIADLSDGEQHLRFVKRNGLGVETVVKAKDAFKENL